MKFATLIKHLMGITLQVTDHKYSVATLRNDLICGLQSKTWSLILILLYTLVSKSMFSAPEFQFQALTIQLNSSEDNFSIQPPQGKPLASTRK